MRPRRSKTSTAAKPTLTLPTLLPLSLEQQPKSPPKWNQLRRSQRPSRPNATALPTTRTAFRSRRPLFASIIACRHAKPRSWSLSHAATPLHALPSNWWCPKTPSHAQQAHLRQAGHSQEARTGRPAGNVQPKRLKRLVRYITILTKANGVAYIG